MWGGRLHRLLSAGQRLGGDVGTRHHAGFCITLGLCERRLQLLPRGHRRRWSDPIRIYGSCHGDGDGTGTVVGRRGAVRAVGLVGDRGWVGHAEGVRLVLVGLVSGRGQHVDRHLRVVPGAGVGADDALAIGVDAAEQVGRRQRLGSGGGLGSNPLDGRLLLGLVRPRLPGGFVREVYVVVVTTDHRKVPVHHRLQLLHRARSDRTRLVIGATGSPPLVAQRFGCRRGGGFQREILWNWGRHRWTHQVRTVGGCTLHVLLHASADKITEGIITIGL